MWYIGHDFYCDILLMTLCFYFVKQHYHSEHFINKRKEITVNNINIQTCFHVQAAWKQHGPKHPQHQLPTLSSHFSKKKKKKHLPERSTLDSLLLISTFSAHQQLPAHPSTRSHGRRNRKREDKRDPKVCAVCRPLPLRWADGTLLLLPEIFFLFALILFVKLLEWMTVRATVRRASQKEIKQTGCVGQGDSAQG